MSNVLGLFPIPGDSIEKEDNSEGFNLPSRCIIDLKDVGMFGE